MFSPDLDILAAARRDMARQQLQTLMIIFAVGLVMLFVIGLVVRDGETLYLTGINLVVLAAIAWLRSRDQLTAAAFLASLTLLATAIWGTWTSRFGLLDSTAIVFLAATVYGTLMLPGRQFLTVLGLTLVSVVVVGFRSRLGLVADGAENLTMPIDVAVVAVTSILVALAVRRQNEMLWDTLQRAVANERELAISHAELQRRQDLILASEQRWRSLVTAAPDWILQLDRTSTIVFANRHGFFGGDPVDHRLEEIVDPDDQAPITAAIEATISRGATSNLELGVQGLEGRRRCAFHLGPLQSDSGVDGAIVLVRDVTERHVLREQLMQTQKLDSIGQLAGGIAHDFNNLLTAMGGHADLASMKLAAADPAQEDLDVILRTVDNASALTAKILAFSRRQPLRRQPVDLAMAIEEMQLLLERLIDADIELEKTLARDLPRIEADPGTLEQVVMNLVVNARDAIRAHPEPIARHIGIAARLVMIDGESSVALDGLEPGPYVELSVSDTGVGMSEDLQSRIFEPFFTTKDAGHGTGLGLAMVYGIVAQSGGTIRVESTPEVGSCLRLYWPTTEAAALASLDVGERPDQLTGTEHVLVVEDNEAVRQLAVSALDRLGYRVTEACDGQEALRLFADHGDVDIVFTDVVMPGLNGFELRERLPDHTPVILSSGHTDLSWLPDGSAPAAETYLPKPYGLEDLARKVRDVLDGT